MTLSPEEVVWNPSPRVWEMAAEPAGLISMILQSRPGRV